MSGTWSTQANTRNYFAILNGSILLAAARAVPRPVAKTSAPGGGNDISKDCTPCHGDGSRAATAQNPGLPAAPPKETKKQTDLTAPGVGAHQRHLTTGALRAALSCAECHALPTSAGHSNGTVDLMWGPLATSGGAQPQWNGASCSASCCHGNFTGGNTAYAPATGEHSRGNDVDAGCGVCHSGYSSPAVNEALHLKGAKDFGGSGTSINTWNAGTKSGSPSCRGSETW